MPFGIRKRIPILGKLFYLNLSKSGLSWSSKIGPFTYNSRQRKARVDLPGPFYWLSKKRGGRS